jgi:hypothetical protein
MKTFSEYEVLTAADLNANFAEVGEITEVTAVPVDGWGSNLFFVREGSVVMCDGYMYPAAQYTLTTSALQVGTVPTGYRPRRIQRLRVFASGGSSVLEYLIYADGRVSIRALSGATAPTILPTSLYVIGGACWARP